MNDEYYLLREIALLLKHKKNEEASQLYEKLGHLFFNRALYQKALAAYQKALSLFPEDQKYQAIAEIYEKLNQNHLAEEALSHIQEPKLSKNVNPEGPRFKDSKDLQRGDSSRPSGAFGMTPQSPSSLDGKEKPSSPKDIVQALEKDLGIQIEAPAKTSPFRLATPLEELSTQSLIELAISHKEMGLISEAIDYLKKALATTQDPSLALTSTHLLGLCYLEKELYFDCISLLEKTLQQNLSLPKELRLELLYSLSHAYELSGNDGKALYCLRQIEKEEKFYRDIEDRIKKIRSKNTF